MAVRGGGDHASGSACQVGLARGRTGFRGGSTGGSSFGEKKKSCSPGSLFRSLRWEGSRRDAQGLCGKKDVPVEGRTERRMLSDVEKRRREYGLFWGISSRGRRGGEGVKGEVNRGGGGTSAVVGELFPVNAEGELPKTWDTRSSRGRGEKN